MKDDGYDKDKISEEISKLREQVQNSDSDRGSINRSKFLGSAGNLTPFVKGLRGGFEFVISIVIGGVIGFVLDKYFDTRPFLLILFVVFGFFAGLKNMYSFLTRK